MISDPPTSAWPLRILVTGATGFLGGAAVHALLQAGHQVRATGRDREKGRALERLGAFFHPVDLRDLSTVAPLLDGVDAALHCAARSTLWGNWKDFVTDNVDVSATLARACSERGVRLVHVSTPSVYNATGLSLNIPESTPVGPHFDSRYARSKYLAELQVRAALPDATILRPRGIYGPGDPSIVPKLARALQSGHLPRLTRHEVHTELTHVRNVAHAARLALERPAPGVFNVTDGVTIPLWATIDRLADTLSVPRPQRSLPPRLVEAAAALLEAAYHLRPGHPEPPLTASGVRLLTRGLTLDLTRARTILGYVPPVHPNDGLQDALQRLRT